MTKKKPQHPLWQTAQRVWHWPSKREGHLATQCAIDSLPYFGVNVSQGRWRNILVWGGQERSGWELFFCFFSSKHQCIGSRIESLLWFVIHFLKPSGPRRACTWPWQATVTDFEACLWTLRCGWRMALTKQYYGGAKLVGTWAFFLSSMQNSRTWLNQNPTTSLAWKRLMRSLMVKSKTLPNSSRASQV